MSAAPQWIRVECHFGSLFSYRIPDFNSFYALASPVPSPSTVKLSLVSALIEATADVARGERLFLHLRGAPVALAPPPLVTASRVLIRRLKESRQDAGKAKGGKAAQKAQPEDRRFTETFGIREYLHCGGPLVFWLQPPAEALADSLLAARHLRRLGTTDSLLTAHATTVPDPDWPICARRVDKLPVDPSLLQGRLVLPLKDLTPRAALACFAPAGAPRTAAAVLQSFTYVLPLRVTKQGANWVLYERDPFPPGLP